MMNISFDDNLFRTVRFEIHDPINNLSKSKLRATTLAQRMYEQIKFLIIEAFNAGEYEFVGDEVVISTLCEFPQMYLKNFVTKAIRDSVSFKLAPQYLDECNLMTMQLRRYLEPEKIAAKVRVFDQKAGAVFQLSKEYRNISNNKNDYGLGMLCTCTIPSEAIGRLNQCVLSLNLLSSDTNNHIKIQWSNIPKAQRYEIWRWEDPCNKVMLGTNGKNSTLFTDRNALHGAELFYQVICVCDDGCVVESPIEAITCLSKSPDERMDNEKARDIDRMEGHEFERFCAKLLVRNGYKNVAVTKGSGDQGIDIIAFKDDIKFGIQCKCYSMDIGNSAIQQAYAGKKFYDCHVGVVLTNRYFTKSAKELAQKSGILLWDRDRLFKMTQNLK